MKKILLLLLFLLILFGGYIVYDKFFTGIPKLEVEEEAVSIDEIIIYGTHLNMHGSIVNDENLDLVLYNGEFTTYDINIDDTGFDLSDVINDGIDLEEIPVGTYYAFLRSSTKDDEENDIFRYYVLKNESDYEEAEYYTFSNVGNKIIINSDQEYGTLTFDVSKNHDEEVYDVVIDPGHGGMDSGAAKNGIDEATYTMKTALKLKEQLEKQGVKVKLTREENQLSSNELLSDYGEHGRAVIGHEVHAKYVFSIHLNSNAATSVHGVEVYTAANINYDFAKNLAKNIVKYANTSYSTNRTSKVMDGVYTKVFTEYDIKSSLEEYKKKNMEAFDITTKSNYYFMIRETGGIMTGAYVDTRNAPKNAGNPYYNSNVGSEAYLIELAYLTNADDVYNIKNNLDDYVTAIADTFEPIFEKE